MAAAKKPALKATVTKPKPEAPKEKQAKHDADFIKTHYTGRYDPRVTR